MTRRVERVPDDATVVIRSTNRRTLIWAQEPIAKLPADSRMTVWVQNADHLDRPVLETLLGSALVMGRDWELVDPPASVR